MIPVAEARARILAPLRPVGTEVVGLAQAWGRVLAEPVAARVTQPPADMSSMDGYAVRAADTAAGASLHVIGAAPAGHPFDGVVEAGQAVRLFTGSVLPRGADAVVPQEAVERSGDAIRLAGAVQANAHVRSGGKDFRVGDILLQAGTRLDARAIGLAAAANHPWLPVHRRPRVAILATGDEVVLPGEALCAGAIVSSNAHALAALVHAAGGDATLLPIARDDLDAIGSLATGAGADLLLTTGGASVGDHDLIRSALERRGFALDFWQVAMRPGKPLLSGWLDGTPVIGLPGNPVSAYVCAVLFVVPALARLGGMADAGLQVEPALLGAAVPANDHRADHLRATLHQDEGGRLTATPFAHQDSSLLTVLSRADALILRPPHARPLPPGASVSIVRLHGGAKTAS